MPTYSFTTLAHCQHLCHKFIAPLSIHDSGKSSIAFPSRQESICLSSACIIHLYIILFLTLSGQWHFLICNDTLGIPEYRWRMYWQLISVCRGRSFPIDLFIFLKFQNCKSSKHILRRLVVTRVWEGVERGKLLFKGV